MKPSYQTLLTIVALCILAVAAIAGPSAPRSATAETLAGPVAPATIEPTPIPHGDCGNNRKCWTGIHLGNMGYDDWTPSLLKYIDGGSSSLAPTGIWPDVVVLMSGHVYSRVWNVNCEVNSAWIPATRQNIRKYLQQATAAGVKIVIRLYPSPGNFQVNDIYRTLNTERIHPCTDPGGESQPRHVNSLVSEMVKIHEYNAANGIEEYGFEPANEPAIEWFPNDGFSPIYWQVGAWDQIDDFFFQVWFRGHEAGVRVFAPSQANFAYAETVNLLTAGCDQMDLEGYSISGYERANGIYYADNDGIAWHSYWIPGYEPYRACDASMAPGWHVSYYFPLDMKLGIRQRGGVITEADLYSGEYHGGQQLEHNYKDLYPATTAYSLRNWIKAERDFWGPSMAEMPIAAWLLVDDTNNYEIEFHEAYVNINDPEPREWFPYFWLSEEK